MGAGPGRRVTDGDGGGYAPACLFNAMDGAGAHCARPNTLATDRAFEVGSYHCVCVLESDVAEGTAFKPAAPVGGPQPEADPHKPTANFDAIGHSCVELLLPMAKMVRALEPGQMLKIVTDARGYRLLVPDDRQRAGGSCQGRRLR